MSGKSVEVEGETSEGRFFERTLTLDDLPFARLYSFRNADRNYSAFTNSRNRSSYRQHPNTIFAKFRMRMEKNPLFSLAHGN